MLLLPPSINTQPAFLLHSFCCYYNILPLSTTDPPTSMTFIPLCKVCPSFFSVRLYRDRKSIGRAEVDDVTYMSELIKENNYLKSDVNARNNVLMPYRNLGDFDEETRHQFLSIIPFLPRNGETIVLSSPIVLQQPFHSIATIEAKTAQDIINLWRMEVENQWFWW